MAKRITKKLLHAIADGINNGNWTEYTCLMSEDSTVVGYMDTRDAFSKLLVSNGVPARTLLDGKFDVSGSAFYIANTGSLSQDRDAAQTLRFDFLNLLAESL